MPLFSHPTPDPPTPGVAGRGAGGTGACVRGRLAGAAARLSARPAGRSRSPRPPPPSTLRTSSCDSRSGYGRLGRGTLMSLGVVVHPPPDSRSGYGHGGWAVGDCRFRTPRLPPKPNLDSALETGTGSQSPVLDILMRQSEIQFVVCFLASDTIRASVSTSGSST